MNEIIFCWINVLLTYIICYQFYRSGKKSGEFKGFKIFLCWCIFITIWNIILTYDELNL